MIADKQCYNAFRGALAELLRYNRANPNEILHKIVVASFLPSLNIPEPVMGSDFILSYYLTGILSSLPFSPMIAHVALAWRSLYTTTQTLSLTPTEMEAFTLQMNVNSEAVGDMKKSHFKSLIESGTIAKRSSSSNISSVKLHISSTSSLHTKLVIFILILNSVVSFPMRSSSVSWLPWRTAKMLNL